MRAGGNQDPVQSLFSKNQNQLHGRLWARSWRQERLELSGARIRNRTVTSCYGPGILSSGHHRSQLAPVKRFQSLPNSEPTRSFPFLPVLPCRSAMISAMIVLARFASLPPLLRRQMTTIGASASATGCGVHPGSGDKLCDSHHGLDYRLLGSWRLPLGLQPHLRRKRLRAKGRWHTFSRDDD
jgi:hypothetical protein